MLKNTRKISIVTKLVLPFVVSLFCLASHAQVKLTLIPSEGEEHKITVDAEVVKLSPALRNMLEDLGDDIGGQPIPLPYVNARTLKALFASVEALYKFKSEEKNASYEDIKAFVIHAFDANASKDDLINFLQAANFLAVSDELMRAAAALLVDKIIGEPNTSDEWKNAADKLKKELDQYKLPPDIMALFTSYINWFKIPSPPSIIVGQMPNQLIAAGRKLYVNNENDQSISIIDMPLEKVIGEPIELDFTIGKMGILRDKLFLTDLKNEKLRTIDLTINKIIEPSTKIGIPAWALLVYGSKIYVGQSETIELFEIIDIKDDSEDTKAEDIKTSEKNKAAFKLDTTIELDHEGTKPNSINYIVAVGTKLYIGDYSSNKIFIVDTNTNAVLGNPIEIKEAPTAMVNAGTKLYVAHYMQNEITVIDATKNEVIKTISIANPVALVADKNKLFIINDNVFVLDTKTDSIIDEIPVGRDMLGDVALFENKLFAASYSPTSNNIWVIDVLIFPILAQKAFARVNARDFSGNTKLIKIIENAKKKELLEEVKKQLELGADPMLPNKSGDSAVKIALNTRNDDMLSLLCDNYIVVNTIDAYKISHPNLDDDDSFMAMLAKKCEALSAKK